MSTNELAISYAALILADEQAEITSDALLSLTKAANVTVEPIWASLFAKALEGKDVKELLLNVGGGGAPAAGMFCLMRGWLGVNGGVRVWSDVRTQFCVLPPLVPLPVPPRRPPLRRRRRRRRSPTTTWASVSSTKRLASSLSRLLGVNLLEFSLSSSIMNLDLAFSVSK
ncbi:hypothetical protein G7K_3195-t1 [Saitoella complicata NRRL Y-17804]|uniref:60S acidic ribosomal protein P1 n=1 Tax=Saitoella complicata (strain BCRC 22490 / CBS 7301 / JCM 7358 / NBRC 10748 / NRRL Y-17804) TaxID=698492 RepID=A0A0E9NGR6_SAICN|nr:hypothetical protein G7K_3195-t1 [Saitoella complicata NRRL Y-17804]